jgi:glycosyltransferase involved in cell wall biosynthesis
VRVALVHDWLVTYRGGEKVLEAMLELFPDADLFTLIHQKGALPESIESRRPRVSALDRLPGIHRRYRHFLPLLPWAVSTLKLRGYDLVISSSHCVAKGVAIPPGARHLSYVHAPMRYMWDRFDDYFGPGRAGLVTRSAARALRPWLQRWDRSSSAAIDRIVANSRNVADKVQRFWGREASVVHPPVELDRFASAPLPQGRGHYFLCAGAFAPYKRVDRVIETFRALGPKWPLVVAGSGQDQSKLSAAPGAEHIRFVGQVSDEELVRLYREARAMVFAADEDFGITPLESLASGRPVIALSKGGALETVTEETGIFFPEQTVESLSQALRQFVREEERFKPASLRARALQFSKAAFQEALMREVAAVGRG